MSDFDELLSTLAAVVGQERLPEEVESNLRGIFVCFLLITATT